MADSAEERRPPHLGRWWLSGVDVHLADVTGIAAGVLLAAKWGRPTAALMIGLAAAFGLASGVKRFHGRPGSAFARPSLIRVHLVFGLPTVLVIALYLAMRSDVAALGALRSGALVFTGWAVVRCAVSSARSRRRRAGRGLQRALVVGADPVGRRIAAGLRDEPRYGIRVVGFVDDAAVHADLPAPLLGSVDDLVRLVDEQRIEVVLIAFGARPPDQLVNPLRELAGRRCEVDLVPHPLELGGAPVHDGWTVDRIPLVRLRPPAAALLSWRLKRLFDVSAAAVALVLTGPILAVTALAVRWETGPGVVFRQQRVGRDGRVFTLYKFRSLKPAGNEGDVTWSIDNDTRMGPVGRVIRRTCLDELPQLVNILKGDMSFVGPRPERPYFVEQFSKSIDGYQYRHRMPAGLTGFAVIHGLRGDTSIRDRSHFDNLYAESWSLWLDVKIMLRTAAQVAGVLVHRPAPPTPEPADGQER